MTERPAVGAAIDLGSNSVHLLVAVIAGHRLRPIVDESVFLGLGAAVDGAASLGAAKRAELVDALAGYVATARGLRAEAITIMGTEPLRRAGDASRAVAELDARVGVPLHVLTHEEEALLTLIGVTGGRPVEHETLVIDSGGGSSEFCDVAPGRAARAFGLRIGANGLTKRIGPSDPPAAADLDGMRAEAARIFDVAVPAAPAEVVMVGGTASNLLKVTAAGPSDPILDAPRVAEALRHLGAGPAAATSERYGVNPTRARLLPAGAIIVESVMRRYGVDRVRVSEAGMREGAVLAADHAGRAWRDRLEPLAHGWRT